MQLSSFPQELISEEIERHLDDPSKASLAFVLKIRGGIYKITSFPPECFKYHFQFVRMFKKFLNTLPPGFVCRSAALNGNLLLLDWATNNNYKYSTSHHTPDTIPETVASAGYFRILRWLHRRNYVVLNDTIYTAALKSNNQKMIRWIENLRPDFQFQIRPKPIEQDLIDWPKITNPELEIDDSLEEIQDIAEEYLELHFGICVSIC